MNTAKMSTWGCLEDAWGCLCCLRRCPPAPRNRKGPRLIASGGGDRDDHFGSRAALGSANRPTFNPCPRERAYTRGSAIMNRHFAAVLTSMSLLTGLFFSAVALLSPAMAADSAAIPDLSGQWGRDMLFF